VIAFPVLSKPQSYTTIHGDRHRNFSELDFSEPDPLASNLMRPGVYASRIRAHRCRHTREFFAGTSCLLLLNADDNVYSIPASTPGPSPHAAAIHTESALSQQFGYMLVWQRKPQIRSPRPDIDKCPLNGFISVIGTASYRTKSLPRNSQWNPHELLPGICKIPLAFFPKYVCFCRTRTSQSQYRDHQTLTIN
jgi:hypothetical protein